MTKLLSLKDKPVTKEDVGKKIYDLDGEFLTLTSETLEEDIFLTKCFARLYWNKPVIISEDEYNKMKHIINRFINKSNRCHCSPKIRNNSDVKSLYDIQIEAEEVLKDE